MMPRSRRRIGQHTAIALLAAAVVCAAGGCRLFSNVPPIAVILADRIDGTAPLQVRFDARDSHDEDGIITTCRWVFGDSTTEHGSVISHVFSIPGTYTVELTVLDDDGASSVAQLTIVVREPNIAPTAMFTLVPAVAVSDEPVAFDATGSHDPDGILVSYLWDFGDGSIGSGPTAVHRFPTAGTFPVTLTVTDDDGARASQVASVQVADSNAPPVPIFSVTPSSAAPGVSIRFDASDSYDADGEITATAWQFGDGATGDGSIVDHAYASSGTYRVDLVVTDDHGVSRGSSRTLTIGEVGEDPVDTGATLIERYTWTYRGLTRHLEMEIPTDLLAHYRSQPRDSWPFRDYDEYVLDPLDDALMAAIAASLDLADYYATVENALFFVQQCIGYQLDPGPFEYPRYPIETLVDRAGDCEDTAILYASLIRTLGHGALLVAVDTVGTGTPNHMAVLVPVDAAYVDSFPPGTRSFWEIGGSLYAFAETAVEGGSLALGIDPWGLDSGDLTQTWDVARADMEPKRLDRTR